MGLLLDTERTAVVEYGRRMVADGLVVGTSGNLSVRSGDLVAVSPSGVPYADLTPALVGVHRLDGEPVAAPLPPTSEMAVHLACYRRPDVVAVVHTHSVAATAASAVTDRITAVHYQVATFGGPVRVAAYETYGTPALAGAMEHAMRGRTACLLGNHGAVTVGGSLAEAYSRAQYLEWLCDVWLRATGSGRPVRTLGRGEIRRVVAKFASYGPFRRSDTR